MSQQRNRHQTPPWTRQLWLDFYRTLKYQKSQTGQLIQLLHYHEAQLLAGQELCLLHSSRKPSDLRTRPTRYDGTFVWTCTCRISVATKQIFYLRSWQFRSVRYVLKLADMKMTDRSFLCVNANILSYHKNQKSMYLRLTVSMFIFS